MIIAEGKIKDRVAIIWGRFQPITRAHYDMINKALSMYQRVYILPTQGEKAFTTSAKTIKGKNSELKRKLTRSPFPVGLRIELIKKAFPNLDTKRILRLKYGGIQYVYNYLTKMYKRESFNKIDVFAGEDEYNDYVRQVKEMTEKDEYKNLDISVIKYDAGTREKISATKVRKAIANKDEVAGFKEYKKLVPLSIAEKGTFHRLRRVMIGVNNHDIEENMRTFKDKINKSIKTPYIVAGEGDDELADLEQKIKKGWIKFWKKGKTA